MSTVLDGQGLSIETSLSVRREYEAAISVQDACNLSGVVRSFYESRELIVAELEKTPGQFGKVVQGGTRWRATHPISVLYASKLHDLACLGLSCPSRFALAYNFASAVKARLWEVGSAEHYQALENYYIAFGRCN
jgi:hypothetical protein